MRRIRATRGDPVIELGLRARGIGMRNDKPASTESRGSDLNEQRLVRLYSGSEVGQTLPHEAGAWHGIRNLVRSAQRFAMQLLGIDYARLADHAGHA